MHDIGEACGFSYALDEMVHARGERILVEKERRIRFLSKETGAACRGEPNVFLPASDLVDSIYAAINGTIDDIKNVCNADHRCAGFYTCSAISRESRRCVQQ